MVDCPSCGAPIEAHLGKCPYCGTILSTGEKSMENPIRSQVVTEDPSVKRRKQEEQEKNQIQKASCIFIIGIAITVFATVLEELSFLLIFGIILCVLGAIKLKEFAKK